MLVSPYRKIRHIFLQAILNSSLSITLRFVEQKLQKKVPYLDAKFTLKVLSQRRPSNGAMKV